MMAASILRLKLLGMALNCIYLWIASLTGHHRDIISIFQKGNHPLNIRNTQKKEVKVGIVSLKTSYLFSCRVDIFGKRTVKQRQKKLCLYPSIYI